MVSSRVRSAFSGATCSTRYGSRGTRRSRSRESQSRRGRLGGTARGARPVGLRRVAVGEELSAVGVTAGAVPAAAPIPRAHVGLAGGTAHRVRQRATETIEGAHGWSTPYRHGAGQPPPATPSAIGPA